MQVNSGVNLTSVNILNSIFYKPLKSQVSKRVSKTQQVENDEEKSQLKFVRANVTIGSLIHVTHVQTNRETSLLPFCSTILQARTSR